MDKPRVEANKPLVGTVERHVGASEPHVGTNKPLVGMIEPHVGMDERRVGTIEWQGATGGRDCESFARSRRGAGGHR